MCVCVCVNVQFGKIGFVDVDVCSNSKAHRISGNAAVFRFGFRCRMSIAKIGFAVCGSNRNFARKRSDHCGIARSIKR